MLKRLTLTILLSALIIATPGYAEDEDRPVEIAEYMALSKLVGLCEALKQMEQFQTDAQTPGGEEFVARFILAASARLGLSAVEMAEICKERTELYEELFSFHTKAWGGAE